MDQWEGQDFPISPGNLYSAPRRVHIDPRSDETVRFSLDRKIPPIAVPADTPWVKQVRFESPLLSKFWGQPIFIGATILLPKDYESDPSASYPVNYEQGHFSLRAPGGFGEDDGAPRPTRRSAQKAAGSAHGGLHAGPGSRATSRRCST